MGQQSELLRRLRQLPGERRDELLSRLARATSGARSARLSYRQEQLWLFDRLAPSSLAYGLGFAFPIDDPLDEAALRAALGDLLERHTVLRSTFSEEDPRGTQQVQPVPEVRLTVEDVADGRLRPRADEVVRDDLRRGLDLSTGPVVRFRLLRATPAQHLLVLSSHYIVLDPRSARVLQRDLAFAYGARAAGHAPRWSREPVEFGAYASWQRDWSGQDDARAAVEYWRGALAGWESTELPTDSPRPRLLDLTSDMVTAPMTPELLAAADTLVSTGGERDDVLLAALLVVIARHTARGDLTIGLPLDVTGPFDADVLVGDCGNLMPLRVELDEADSFADVVARVRTARLAGADHAMLPFKLILAALKVEPDPGRLPLVQIGFANTGEPAEPVAAGNVRIGCAQVDAGAGAFELAFEVSGGERPTVTVRFATSLYRRTTVARLLDRFLQTLDDLCARPERPLGDATLGTPRERIDVLEHWNPRIGEPRDATVHELFAEIAAAQPDRTAFVQQHGSLTYGELDGWSRRIANRLVASGVRLGDLIPVVMERGPALIASAIGVMRAGAAYVPLDVGQPDERLAMILADTGASTIVVSPVTAERVSPSQALVVGPDPVDEALAAPAAAPVACPPATAAYVIYTSGSTGRPKGVVVEHRNVTNFVRTVRAMFDLTPEDRVLHFASPGFDVSVFEIFGALLSGAVLYVVDEDQRRSVDALDAVLREQRITVVDLPPPVMELLAPEDYPDVRVAFVGGEAFTGELTTRWARGRAFWNGYGPTETTVTVVAKLCEGEWTSSPPIGRAMANHRAYVVDAAGSGVLPPGAIGELAIAGLGVARGYLGRPDLTADRFRPDPHGPPGSRRYLSGDLAAWDDTGDLHFVGRVDRQVKVRGVRIELGEVEAALQAVAGVAQSVVAVVIHPKTGPMLIAYVVPERPGELQLDLVRAAVAGRLPSAMVPSVLVPLDALPLTPSGKIDRRRLPAVEFAADELTDVDEENSTPTERLMRAEVFAPLLGMRIGNDVNFFAAGGTSLQAIQLSSRVNTVFGVAPAIADFFANPTVAGLAALVDTASSRQRSQQDALAEALSLVEGRSDAEIAELAAELDGDDAGAGTAEPAAALTAEPGAGLTGAGAVPVEAVVESAVEVDGVGAVPARSASPTVVESASDSVEIGPISYTMDSLWVRRVPRPDARLRLICLPFAGGGASAFQRMAALLPPWVETIAVQPPGREDRSLEQPPGRISGLVAACAIALRPYTTMPYALYGHCAGGLLAFEIAHEMGRRFGTWPERLIVGEQPAPQAPPPAERLHELPDEQLLAAVQDRGGLPEAVAANADLRQFLLPLLRSEFTLWENYCYQPRLPLPVPITTIRGLSGAVDETALAGWAGQTSAGRTAVTVEGGHYFVVGLTPAAAHEISAQLSAGAPSAAEDERTPA